MSSRIVSNLALPGNIPTLLTISLSFWFVFLLEQELLTLPEHLSSPLVCSGVRVTRYLVLYVCFGDLCLSFCTFFFWQLCCLFFFDIWFLITSLWNIQTLLDTSLWTTSLRYLFLSLCTKFHGLIEPTKTMKIDIQQKIMNLQYTENSMNF
jgi:hypothetical protein